MYRLHHLLVVQHLRWYADLRRNRPHLRWHGIVRSGSDLSEHIDLSGLHDLPFADML